ncbi:MAG: type III-A CRISPR-associated RAMP protein Csm3 [Anaerolineae bacterium]|nr:type III-A CRISPR-associated RAMP protein Csm3 [Anaerolineae bacterium]
MAAKLKLLGRVIVTGKIETKTGLHIGGTPGALAIGGVDMPVIRDARTNRPYIPGSSLKGKMRSLAEKSSGAPQNRGIGKDVTIHIAGGDKRAYRDPAEYRRVGEQEYKEFWVNPIFGVPGEVGFDITAPNRLIVRDVPLSEESEQELLAIKTDLPFTEVKWEAAIDRVTSAATPRQIERVPAGAVFSPMELVFSVYLNEDVALFDHILTCLQLVEDDYLGGHGSRGSGKVEFRGLKIVCKRGDDYKPQPIASEENLENLVAARGQIQSDLKQALGVA